MRLKLDRYDIQGELGQGGMSVVFRARDKALSRDVAVKVLHEHLAKDPDARRRFKREATAVAKLHHPGILEIFDYSDAEDDVAYIVTELIEGRTLRAFVDHFERPRFPELGVLIVCELTRALRHAHEQGVIHRDLKPENVMITADGQLKLMDFGIAQIMGGGTKLTMTGTLLGSPAHMAPEVIDGEFSDHRADIFSMGTILYWLTTGRLPFEAPNPSALFRRILEGTYETPQALEPRIGNRLTRIVERALDANRDARYQDVSELHADLQRELEAVDMVPAERQVIRYLKDPLAYSDALGPRLVDTLARAGTLALKQGNTGRALDRFNRVLAIDPNHRDVETQMRRVGRRQDLARRTKQGALGFGMLGLVAVIGYGAVQIQGEAKPTEPKALVPTPTLSKTLSAETPPRNPQPPGASDGEKEKSDGAPETMAKETRQKGSTANALAGGNGRKSAPSAPTRPPRPQATARKAAAVTPSAPKKLAQAPEQTTGRLDKTTPETPLRTKVQVTLGGSWGYVYIDGHKRSKGALKPTFELAPGTYRFEVVKPGFGRTAPKTVVVEDDLQVFVINGNGSRLATGPQGVRFRLPRPGAETPKDWIKD